MRMAQYASDFARRCGSRCSAQRRPRRAAAACDRARRRATDARRRRRPPRAAPAEPRAAYAVEVRIDRSRAEVALDLRPAAAGCALMVARAARGRSRHCRALTDVAFAPRRRRARCACASACRRTSRPASTAGCSLDEATSRPVGTLSVRVGRAMTAARTADWRRSSLVPAMLARVRRRDPRRALRLPAAARAAPPSLQPGRRLPAPRRPHAAAEPLHRHRARLRRRRWRTRCAPPSRSSCCTTPFWCTTTSRTTATSAAAGRRCTRCTACRWRSTSATRSPLLGLRALIDNRAALGPRLALLRARGGRAHGARVDRGPGDRARLAARQRRSRLSDADYLEMVLKKTCWYTTIYPSRVGALIGTRGAADLDRFMRFGFFLGAAFQIQDDLLNLAGDPRRYGKELDGDLWEGKRTLMLIHLLRSAAPPPSAPVSPSSSPSRAASAGRPTSPGCASAWTPTAASTHAQRIAHGLAGAALPRMRGRAARRSRLTRHTLHRCPAVVGARTPLNARAANIRRGAGVSPVSGFCFSPYRLLC